MQCPKLIDTLSLFSRENLRKYLGEELLEQFKFEWEENGEVFTKRKLAEMLIQLNGVELLKKQDFRRAVVRHLDSSDIEMIFDKLPAIKKKNIFSLEEKVETIAALSWSKSDALVKLLEILGLNESLLIGPESEESTIEIAQQAGKRFYELLDYQFVIKQRVLAELNKENPLKRMLVHMPTGTGKTKTAMHTLVHYYNFSLKKEGAIIWLAHTTELLQQAYDTFTNVWEHLGDGQINSYKLWGKKNVAIPVDGFDGILFCGIQKLQAIRQNQPELYSQIVKDARLIVFDEAHKAVAAETRQMIESFMIMPPGFEDRSLLGLTATPGRTTLTSDENKLLSNFFENRLIGIELDVVNRLNMSQEMYLNMEKEYNVIKYFQNLNILAKITKEQLTYDEEFSEETLKKIQTKMFDNGYVDFSKMTLELISKNRSRNSAIINRLKQLYEEKIPTIVFACSVNHAKLLSLMLSFNNIPNAIVLGEMNAKERSEAIAAFKNLDNPTKILINYEVLTTGFDATNIRCVFITRPTQSIILYSQMIGRGLRGPLMGGNPECLLIDLKDNLGKYNSEMAFNHFDSYWT